MCREWHCRATVGFAWSRISFPCLGSRNVYVFYPRTRGIFAPPYAHRLTPLRITATMSMGNVAPEGDVAMSRTRKHLTDRLIRTISPPVGRASVMAYDDAAPGLGIRVYHATDMAPRGAHRWFWRGTVRGRRIYRVLGSWPAMTPAAARRAAAELVGELKGGVKVAQPPAPPTLPAILWPLVRGNQVKRGRANRIIRELLPLAPSATDLTTVEIRRWFDRIVASKPAEAAKQLMLLRAAYRAAIDRGELTTDPTAGIRAPSSRSRDRWVTPSEMPRLLAAIEQEDTVAAIFLACLLFTGARRAELLRSEWGAVDRGEGIITIPRAKTGENQRMILPKQAVELLEQLRPDSPDPASPVFPASSRNGKYIDDRGPWSRVRARAELEDLHLHDLRRSLASWMIETECDPIVIARALRHTVGSVTAIYARPSEARTRAAMERAIKAMLSSRT